MPASTSPEPAVASQGGALSAIAARPSGAATTVSAPFSTTIAPKRAAACRARSSFGPCRARHRGRAGRTRRRAASAPPAAAVAAWLRTASSPARSARSVSGRRRRAPRPPRGERRLDERAAAPPTPSAGPRTTAFLRRSARISASAAPRPPLEPHQHDRRQMRGVGQAASSRGGDGDEARPGPERAAAASRAAPVPVSGPETTRRGRGRTCGRRGVGTGSAAATAAGCRGTAVGRIARNGNRDVDADVGDASPRRRCIRPGRSRWPGFRRKKVTVSTARPRRADDLSGAAVDAARQVDREDRQAGAVDAAIEVGRSALDRPVEPGAEQRVDDEVGADAVEHLRRLDPAVQARRRLGRRRP